MTIAHARIWPTLSTRNRSRQSVRAMPPGGRIGSNQELGIEGSGYQCQRRRGRGTCGLARVLVAGVFISLGCCRIADGLFGQDAELPATVGRVSAWRFAGSESGEQAGATDSVPAGVPR